MKKTYLPLLAALLFVTNTFGQQVDQVQRTLVSNKTATWCQYCGQWGLGLWDEIMAIHNTDKALCAALHQSSSSSLHTDVSTDFVSQFQQYGGTPVFYANEHRNTVYSQTSIKNMIKRIVDSMYQVPPIANVGFNFTINGNNLVVNTKSKFFQAANGEYFVNAYIVRSNVQNDQRIIDDQGVISTVSIKHNGLLHASMTQSNSFGVVLASGNVAQGTETTKQFTYVLDNTWNRADITILTMIWKKNGSKYEFVNGSRKQLVATGIEDIAENNNTIQVFPTVSSSKIFVKVDNNITAPVNIKVFDITGRLVTDKNFGAREGTIELEKSSSFGSQAGVYLVSVQTGEIRKTVRVVIN